MCRSGARMPRVVPTWPSRPRSELPMRALIDRRPPGNPRRYLSGWRHSTGALLEAEALRRQRIITHSECPAAFAANVRLGILMRSLRSGCDR